MGNKLLLKEEQNILNNKTNIMYLNYANWFQSLSMFFIKTTLLDPDKQIDIEKSILEKGEEEYNFQLAPTAKLFYMYFANAQKFNYKIYFGEPFIYRNAINLTFNTSIREQIFNTLIKQQENLPINLSNASFKDIFITDYYEEGDGYTFFLNNIENPVLMGFIDEDVDIMVMQDFINYLLGQTIFVLLSIIKNKETDCHKPNFNKEKLFEVEWLVFYKNLIDSGVDNLCIVREYIKFKNVKYDRFLDGVAPEWNTYNVEFIRFLINNNFRGLSPKDFDCNYYTEKYSNNYTYNK